MKLLKLFLITLTVFAVSCGDSVRNDNGVSFTFFGWFQDDAGDVSATFGRFALEGNGIATGTEVYAGLQNNLSGQFIIVERAYHTYTVPGSAIRIPSTSVGVSSLVRPGPVSTTIGNTTLPNNALTDTNATYAGTNLMPATIGQFISLNRDQLPRLPFQMVVSTYFEGVTSAGRRIKSNPIQFEIEVVSDMNIGGAAEDPAA